MNTTLKCSEPVIVQGCGHEIFNLSQRVAENSLKVLEIDCSAGGKKIEETHKKPSTHAPVVHRQSSLFNRLELYCDANNNGLQECSMDFINYIFNSNDESQINALGQNGGNHFNESNKEEHDLLGLPSMWNTFCNASYQSAASCVARNNLLQVCPNAAFVRGFRDIFTPLCAPESRKKVVASINCLENIKNSENFTDSVAECMDLGNRLKRQLMESEDSDEMMHEMCDGMREFVKCSKDFVSAQCGRETFDFMLKISQNGVLIMDPTCNVTSKTIQNEPDFGTNHSNATNESEEMTMKNETKSKEGVTQNPEYSKKPLAGEATAEKLKNVAINIGASSILMLTMSAIFAF